MHKYQLLRQRAEIFKRTLEEYAKTDSDVEWLLEKFIPWYERIQRQQIRLPCYEFKLGVYFGNSDLSPLAERYGIGAQQNPLRETWVHFEEAIRDELSDPIYLETLKNRGCVPSAILDEPPPPEEETPLLEIPKPSEPRRLHGFLNRWLNKLR